MKSCKKNIKFKNNDHRREQVNVSTLLKPQSYFLIPRWNFITVTADKGDDSFNGYEKLRAVFPQAFHLKDTCQHYVNKRKRRFL